MSFKLSQADYMGAIYEAVSYGQCMTCPPSRWVPRGLKSELYTKICTPNPGGNRSECDSLEFAYRPGLIIGSSLAVLRQ